MPLRYKLRQILLVRTLFVKVWVRVLETEPTWRNTACHAHGDKRHEMPRCLVLQDICMFTFAMGSSVCQYCDWSSIQVRLF